MIFRQGIQIHLCPNPLANKYIKAVVFEIKNLCAQLPSHQYLSHVRAIEQVLSYLFNDLSKHVILS